MFFAKTLLFRQINILKKNWDFVHKHLKKILKFIAIWLLLGILKLKPKNGIKGGNVLVS